MYYNNAFSKAQSKYFKNLISNSIKLSEGYLDIVYQEPYDPDIEAERDTKNVTATVKCSFDNVDQYNIQRYPYGDIAEGDTMFYIVNDENYPSAPEGFPDFDNLSLEFQGKVYTTSREPLKQGFINDDKMFITIAFSN